MATLCTPCIMHLLCQLGQTRTAGLPVKSSVAHMSKYVLLRQGIAVSAVIWPPCIFQLASLCAHLMCQIMPCLCRGSLYQLLHSPSAYLNWHQLVGMCLATAQGMLHLHSHQALHRDLKSGVCRCLHRYNHMCCYVLIYSRLQLEYDSSQELCGHCICAMRSQTTLALFWQAASC